MTMMNSNVVNTKRVTDLTYLLSICGDDLDFKKEMIETFVKNTPILIQEMKDHIKNSSWKEIGDIAHKMKPSITFMGIQTAKGLIIDLERNGKQQESVQDIPELIRKLDSICSVAFTELKAEMS
jgi:HPt (histidine-containing phosphotransfer) domain-containing protein